MNTINASDKNHVLLFLGNNIGGIVNVRSVKGEIILSLEIQESWDNSSKVKILYSRRDITIGNIEIWHNSTLESYLEAEYKYKDQQTSNKDMKALNVATQIMEFINEPINDWQLKAKIQCLLIELLE